MIEPFFVINIMGNIKNLIFVFLLFFTANYNLFADNEWFGEWQSQVMSLDQEKTVMEYNFVNDSIMEMRFLTDENQPSVGRCIYKVSLNGQYYKIGPLFFISLDNKTLKVSILKYYSFSKKNTISEDQLKEQLESKAKLLFESFQSSSMIYVTHEDSDVISFIYGDENSASEIEFRRPLSINQLFNENTETLDLDSIISPTTQVIEEFNQSNSYYNLYDDYEDNSGSSTTISMWKSFGIFLLYLIVSYILVLGIRFLFFCKLIPRKNNAEDAVLIRKIYYFVRILLKVIIIILGIIVWGKLVIDSVLVNKYIAMLVICSGGSLFLHLLSSLSLPINIMTMKKFRNKNRDFVLYLRGFISDDYTPQLEHVADNLKDSEPWKTKTDKADVNPNDLPLNERCLAKSWKRYFQTFSVGRPKELESPEGSTRIFLDNETWQSDVLSLMDSAKYILVCVHSNANCVWEIQQCNSKFPNKTIYYVDDLKKLLTVSEQMGEDLPKCLRSYLFSQNHMVSYLVNDKVIVTPYSNTEEGLSIVVREFFRSNNI